MTLIFLLEGIFGKGTCLLCAECEAISAEEKDAMSRQFGFKVVLVAISLTCLTAPSAAETVAHTYDARGRLIKVVRPNASGQQVQTCYKYDKADNRTNGPPRSPPARRRRAARLSA